MTEHEIRQVLEGVCEEVDLRAKRTSGLRRVLLPAMLGAGLIMSATACYGGPMPRPRGGASAVQTLVEQEAAASAKLGEARSKVAASSERAGSGEPRE